MRSLPRIRRILMASALALPVVACAPNPPALITSAPTSVETTATYKSLRSLPAPKRPVPVAVYNYPDLTGQFKPSDTVSTNSRAVTQGAVWMLVKALKDASSGQWFKVTQRANLENLLRERQIIRETRGRIEKTTGRPQPALPSLLFAGLILEGGIIGYDSNTVTGGLGARYLGIGGDVQYRQDTVTVYLNAISSQTGEVLKSVMTRKTVASYGVRGSVFKFVAFQKLLEGETGYTINEPGQIALAQAIEHAVRALIIEGALEGIWQFEDEIAGKVETQAYLADKDDHLLIGDATSDAALALLTDEQLQDLAKRRKERRQQREVQIARAQAAAPSAPRKAAGEVRPPADSPAKAAKPPVKQPKLVHRGEAPVKEARPPVNSVAKADKPPSKQPKLADRGQAPVKTAAVMPSPQKPALARSGDPSPTARSTGRLPEQRLLAEMVKTVALSEPEIRTAHAAAGRKPAPKTAVSEEKPAHTRTDVSSLPSEQPSVADRSQEPLKTAGAEAQSQAPDLTEQSEPSPAVTSVGRWTGKRLFVKSSAAPVESKAIELPLQETTAVPKTKPDNRADAGSAPLASTGATGDQPDRSDLKLEAAQEQLAKAFSTGMADAVIIDLDLDELPDMTPTTTAIADAGNHGTADNPKDRVTPIWVNQSQQSEKAVR